MDAPRVDPLTDALEDLAGFLFADNDLDATLRRVAELASTSIGGCDMAGVALLEHDAIATGAASEELVDEIDSFQYASGAGPCLECMDVRHVIRVTSTATDERWRSFNANASSKGIGSVLSAPLLLRGRAAGSLNLYGRRTGAFIESDEDDIRLFARRASVMLANARSLDDCHKLAERLRGSLDECDLLGRAAGMIMERDHLTGQEAHIALRRMATRDGLTLEDAARNLLDPGDSDRV